MVKHLLLLKFEEVVQQDNVLDGAEWWKMILVMSGWDKGFEVYFFTFHFISSLDELAIYGHLCLLNPPEALSLLQFFFFLTSFGRK
jgi:hypothetical protein